MAVKIINRTYTDQFRPNESTDWLLGNVGDWQKLTLQCEVASEIIGSNSQTVSINSEEKTITLNNGGNFGQFGFDIGDTCFLRYRLTETDNAGVETVTEITIEFTIDLMQGDTIVYSGGNEFNALDYAIIPTDRGNEKVTNVRIFTEKEFEGARLKYGHMTNATVDNDNLASLVDGSQSEVGIVGIEDAPFNIWQNMELYGLQSGMSIRNPRIRKISNPDSDDTNIAATFNIPEQNFTVETEQISLLGGGISLQAPRSARPIQMTLDNAFPDHAAVSNVGQITNEFTSSGISFNSGVAMSKMFIQDLDNDIEQQYNFSIAFRVQSANDISSNDKISLVLYRYNNGTNLDYVDRTELKSWDNADAQVNAGILFYVQSRTIFGSAGESYALCLEYYHPAGTNSGTRSVTIGQFAGTISIPTNSNTNSFYKRYYEIEFQYMIGAFFDAVDQIDTQTPPDFLLGDGSLTDNFDVKFFPEWNNPNTIVKNVLSETRRLGNTGWFNENFNQLDNDFTIESVVYKDTAGNNVSALDYAQETVVEITISGIPNLSTSTKFGFGFSWIPQDEANFHDKETGYYRNLFISNGSYDDSFSITSDSDPTVRSGAGVNGAQIDTKDIHVTQDGQNAVIKVTFAPNVAFQTYFEAIGADDRKYILWASVADHTINARNQSDRVSLLADTRDLIKTITPAGEYDFMTKFVEHPFNENHVGVDVYEGVTQDDLLVRSRFNIALAQNTRFQIMTFAVEMENSQTGQIFTLESFAVDLSSSPVDAEGHQVFNVDLDRGFKLNEGNNKNWVRIQTDETNSSAESKAYVLYYAFKLRYEDWISRVGVPNDFFDTAEGSDGKANDWFDYINTPNSDWTIKFSIYTQAQVDDEVLVYRNPYLISFKDYNQNDLVETAIRYLRDSDGTLLNVGADPDTGNPLGVILRTEKTRLELDFTIQDAGTWTPGNTYGTVTIEVDKGAGIFEMRQISSVWDVEADNPLQPLANQTKLQLTVSGANKVLTAACLVDSDLLDDAVRYRITGRVGCFDDPDLIEDGRVHETAFEAAYE